MRVTGSDRSTRASPAGHSHGHILAHVAPPMEDGGRSHRPRPACRGGARAAFPDAQRHLIGPRDRTEVDVDATCEQRLDRRAGLPHENCNGIGHRQHRVGVAHVHCLPALDCTAAEKLRGHGCRARIGPVRIGAGCGCAHLRGADDGVGRMRRLDRAEPGAGHGVHDDVKLGRSESAGDGVGQTSEAVAGHLRRRAVGVPQPHGRGANRTVTRRVEHCKDQPVRSYAAAPIAILGGRTGGVALDGQFVYERDEEVVAQPVKLVESQPAGHLCILASSDRIRNAAPRWPAAELDAVSPDRFTSFGVEGVRVRGKAPLM